MKVTRNTLRLAVRMAFITSAGYVIALPIIFGLILIETGDTFIARSAGVGAVFVLVLPAFFLLQWLKKKPYFRDRLFVKHDEKKLFFFVGWGVAGLLFLAFIFNLRWFNSHNTISMLSGFIILWLLIFGTLPSIVRVKKSK